VDAVLLCEHCHSLRKYIGFSWPDRPGGGDASDPLSAKARPRAACPLLRPDARLFDRYNEKRIALALTSGGQLLEILVSPKGSWTIIITQPNGPSCLVSSGDNWQSILPLPGAEGPST
jgi:hypothetical protein